MKVSPFPFSSLSSRSNTRPREKVMASNIALFNALDTASIRTRPIAIASMGFLSASYNLFCFSATSPVPKALGHLYYDPKDGALGRLPARVNNVVVNLAIVGALTGQLVFGWLGDKIGRKQAYKIALVIMAICAICSSIPFGGQKPVIVALSFFRLWIGFSIGAVYPLTATIAAEYSSKKTRGQAISFVFAQQGVGIILAGLVPMLLSLIFISCYRPNPRVSKEDEVLHSTKILENILWRIVLVVGAIPPFLTLYLQREMPETGRYTALIPENSQRAAQDMRRFLDIHIDQDDSVRLLKKFKAANHYPLLSGEFAKMHGLHLVGTTTTWFLLDIAFYSKKLARKDLYKTILKHLTRDASKVNALEDIFLTSRAEVILALLGTFPGYWFTVFFIERLGRFTIQLIGFFMMSLFMLIMGVRYEYITEPMHAGLFALYYGLTFFFANFGPNATTFILPAELFPTRMRCTCHGLSAAAGKAGAMIAAFAVQPYTLNGATGKIKHALMSLAFTNMLGLCCTFLVTETRGRSLEEITGEDDGGQNYERQMQVMMISGDDDVGLNGTEMGSRGP